MQFSFATAITIHQIVWNFVGHLKKGQKNIFFFKNGDRRQYHRENT